MVSRYVFDYYNSLRTGSGEALTLWRVALYETVVWKSECRQEPQLLPIPLLYDLLIFLIRLFHAETAGMHFVVAMRNAGSFWLGVSGPLNNSWLHVENARSYEGRLAAFHMAHLHLDIDDVPTRRIQRRRIIGLRDYGAIYQMWETTIGTMADTMTLNEAITARHSSRVFLPKPVPREILDDALDLARYSPSNTNIQPWRLFVLAGDPLKQLKTAVLAAASATDEPLRAIPPLPAHLEPLRKALGAQVYGAGFNVEWSDRIGRRAAVLRMFEFFDAPAAAIVCVDHELGRPDSLSVGMYLQTLLLALTARGVGSCAEVAVAGYADLIKQQVGIPDNLAVICGLAIGYEDPGHAVNQIRPGRLPASDTTVMMGFEDEERIQE